MDPRKKLWGKKNCRNGSIVRAVRALVLLEVLAVLSCGSIGNIKISHQHSVASIALCHQYWSATVNNQGNPPTWQIPTLCSPKPHQYYPIVIALVCIFRTSPILQFLVESTDLDLEPQNLCSIFLVLSDHLQLEWQIYWARYIIYIAILDILG